jgi:excisionase family DNA binding protein
MTTRSTSEHHDATRSTGGIGPGSRRIDRLLTVGQAAQILGTSRATMQRLLQANLIAHQRVSPRRIVIRESALRAYVDTVTFGPRP